MLIDNPIQLYRQTVWQVNYIALQPGKFMGWHIVMLATVQPVSPPLHHLLPLGDKFGPMNVSRPHTVTLLMAHLPFNGIRTPLA